MGKEKLDVMDSDLVTGVAADKVWFGENVVVLNEDEL